MKGEGARRIVAVVLLVLFTLGLIQCTAKRQVVQEDEETVLRRRVQEYWGYKIKGAWDKSYLYEMPDYREKVTLVAYITQNARSLMKWEGFDILELWTSGENGFVKLNTKYRYLIPQTSKAAFERSFDERWAKREGQWYRVAPGASLQAS